MAKEPFTIIGSIVFNEGRKRFLPKSPDHMQICINRLNVGDAVTLSFSTKKPTRSQSQLNYHFALLGLLKDHTGHSTEELHDFVVRAVFGQKLVTLRNQTFAVRRSVADHASMPKDEMAQLIEYDLATCADLGVVVPTREELGYLPNY